MIYAGDRLRLSTFEIVGFLDAGLSRCDGGFTIRSVVRSRRRFIRESSKPACLLEMHWDICTYYPLQLFRNARIQLASSTVGVN